MSNPRDDIEDGRKPSKQRKLLRSSDDIIVQKNQTKTLRPTSEFVTPLLTDKYQLTMAYAYWLNKSHTNHAVFDLFFRKNPFKGEFTVFAGLEEAIKHISNFHFTQDDIDFLREEMSECDPEFFEWLRTVDCSQIKVWAIHEGTVVFPRIPLLRVEGPIAVVQMLETTLLTLVNFPSLLVTNAARHRLAAGKDKVLFEFGLRRAQGVDGGVSASRYAYMGGFDGSSNMLAAKLFGIPAKGTQAHSFVTSFSSVDDLKFRTLKDSQGHLCDFWVEVCKAREDLNFGDTNKGELVAFASYAIAFPRGFLALVDTYDTLKSGVPNFLIVALALHRLGYIAQGVRLDSGDLAYLSREVRKMYRHVAVKMSIAAFDKMSVVASNDINEGTLLSLEQQNHEIDTFGIGTNLVTCQAQPALGCVFKLVEVEGHPRIKISQEVSKVTLPGKKSAYRIYGSQPYSIIDLMIVGDESPPEVGKRILCLHPFEQKRAYVTPTKVIPLHELYWNGEKVLKTIPSLNELRSFVIKQLDEMRPDHLRLLNPTPYKVSVSQQLHDLIHNMWRDEVPIPDISM